MITAEQIKAARVLLRLDQAELARRANVSVATLRRVESPDSIRQVAAPTVQQVRAALEQSGVRFIPQGVVGKAERTPEEIAALSERLLEIGRRSAARPEGNPNFTEADLHDENGLPR